MMERAIKVSLYEDNAPLRDSLTKLIEAFPEFEMAGAFPNAMDILEDIKRYRPDVILMDIDMPGMSGVDAVALVHRSYPDIKVLMQTVFDDSENVFNSICNGAVGYLLKKTNPSEILEAIKEANMGGAPITPSVASKILGVFRKQAVMVNKEDYDLSEREKDILFQLTKGLSYKMIASECAISIDTVRSHIKKIYEKLHVHSMTEAVAKAIKQKLV